MATATLTKRFDLKVELLRRSLTISEVARRCGVSRGHLSRVMNGRVDLDDKLVRDMARATGISKADILEAAGA